MGIYIYTSSSMDSTTVPYRFEQVVQKIYRTLPNRLWAQNLRVLSTVQSCHNSLALLDTLWDICPPVLHHCVVTGLHSSSTLRFCAQSLIRSNKTTSDSSETMLGCRAFQRFPILISYYRIEFPMLS